MTDRHAPEASGGLPDALHRLPPDRFREHVHSFEYWLETVHGYLDGKHYGRRADLEEASLSPEDRARLAEKLISSLEQETDPDAEALWLREAERRLDELDSGESVTVAAEQVIEKARSAIR